MTTVDMCILYVCEVCMYLAVSSLSVHLSPQFDFSLFGNSIKQGGVFNNKYPAVKPNYESTETSGMYFGKSYPSPLS